MDINAPKAEGKSALYDREYYDKLRDGARSSARAIVPVLLELFKPTSVVDVGCGTGIWLNEVSKGGIDDVMGVDGSWISPEQLEIPVQKFVRCDLTQPFALGRQFDLVMSLEVAEHLPASSAEAFVKSLTKLGPVVIFSAAIPFQGGTDHVNEQWPNYWAQLFKLQGYYVADALRARFWNDSSMEWWYRQNIVCFLRSGQPRPLEDQRWPEDLAFSLVHPDRYVEMASDIKRTASQLEVERAAWTHWVADLQQQVTFLEKEVVPLRQFKTFMRWTRLDRVYRCLRGTTIKRRPC